MLSECAGRHSQFVGVLRVVPGTIATTKGPTDSLLIGSVDRRAPIPSGPGARRFFLSEIQVATRGEPGKARGLWQ